MKKNIFALCIVTLVLLTGCGNSIEATGNQEETISVSEDNTESIEETVEESVVPIEAEEEKQDTLAEVNTTNITFVEAEQKFGEYQEKGFEYPAIHQGMAYYEKDMSNEYYYVGKQDSSFLESLNGEYDDTLWLSVKKHLEGGFGYSVSDESVASIEGSSLIPHKQGTVVLSKYDANGDTVESKTIAVTTYNDGRKSEGTRTAMSLNNNWSMHQYNYDANVWKEDVHTIYDFIFLLQGREMYYSFTEPYWTWCDDWSWCEEGDTIFYMNTGVCIEVAELATWMLQNDYEDMGWILVQGNEGHIYNWFYEDGLYYVVDFTAVISSSPLRADEGYVITKPSIYHDDIKIFSNVEDIAEFAKVKSNIHSNYLITMFSSQGHDYIPATLNRAMHDSNAAYHGEEVIVGYEDIVYDDLAVLWSDPNCNITIQRIDWADIPIAVRSNTHAVYGNLLVAYDISK